MALDRRVEGLIFADARRDDTRFLDEIARRVPMVLVSRHLGTHCAVTCDDVAGGRMAAEHLALGHRDIAVLPGDGTPGCDRRGSSPIAASKGWISRPNGYCIWAVRYP